LVFNLSSYGESSRQLTTGQYGRLFMSVEGIQAAAPRAGCAAGKTLSAMEESSSGVRVAVGAAQRYIPGIPRT
jgi:hypothetical protein